MHNIVIYSKPDCPYCSAAKMFMDSNKMVYEEKMLNIHFTREHLLENFPTAKTFPVIVVDGFYIGGYTQFKTIVESNKVNSSQQLLNEG
jgi:glutaredoxin